MKQPVTNSALRNAVILIARPLSLSLSLSNGGLWLCRVHRG